MADSPPECGQRHTTRVRAKDLSDPLVVILGAGPVSRHLLPQLITTGVSRLRFVDARRVTRPDVAGGFRRSDLGRPRVDVLTELGYDANPRLDIKTGQDPAAILAPSTVVFSCAQNALERRRSWVLFRPRNLFWCDVRTIGTLAQIYTAFDRASQEQYHRLPTKALRVSTVLQLPVGYASVAGVAASFAAFQFAAFTLGRPVRFEMHVDLAARG